MEFNANNNQNVNNQVNSGIKMGTNSELGKIATALTSGENVSVVRIRELEPGELFSGLVYVRKSNYRRNKSNSELFDLYFQCIDGDGVTFRCAMFSTDKKMTIRNEVMYISKGMAVEQIKTGIVYYNIDNISRYTNYTVPISTFLQEITNIEHYYQNVLQIIEDNLKPDQNLYGLYQNIQNKYDYLNLLKTIPYSDTLGTRLGTTLKIINDMCQVYYTLVVPKTEKQLEEYRLFIVCTLMAFVQKALLMYNDINLSKEVNSNFVSELLLPISDDLLVMTYNTPITGITRSKILSILNNMTLYNRGTEIQEKFPLEIMFFNILKTVEKNISVLEMLESRDIQNKRHSSGIYIV